MFTFENFSRFNIKKLQLLIQSGKQPILSKEESEAVYSNFRGQMSHLLEYVVRYT